MLPSKPTVMKFGGTSVEDAPAFLRVADLVSARRRIRPVVVVSAMSCVTDALLAAVRRAREGDSVGAARSLDEHFTRHNDVAHSLLPQDEAGRLDAVVADARRDIERLLGEVAARERPCAALQDEIASYGERLSSQLLAAVLRAQGEAARAVDARRCVITDEEHGCAEPLGEATDQSTRAAVGPVIAAGDIPVLGGFIGSTPAGATTTLGRGGSDYTAALVGAALGAEEIQIWTDVTGVMTADPRVVPQAQTVPRLSYAEAAELAFFGAKVLHPKTILPAVVRRIPVRICNARAPVTEDTVVYFDAEMTPQTVKAIAHKKGIAVMHVTSARMLGAYGFLRNLFEVFDRHRTAVDIVTTSEVSVSLSLDDTSTVGDIVRDLKGVAAVRVEEGRAIICIVGEGLRGTPGIAARTFSTLSDINILLISQGASNINLTFVVEEAHAEEAVRRLHAAFFEQEEEARDGGEVGREVSA